MSALKKRFSPLLALALLLSLTGCMADPTVKPPSPGSVVVPGGNPVAPAPTSSAVPASFSDRGMRIALCTSPGSVNDRICNVACYDGVLRFIISRNLIDTVSPLQELTGESAQAVQFLRSNAMDYDVFLCVGSVFADVADVAKEYPDKFFILMDATAQGQADNLSTLNYAEEQCGFFAGIAAAMETRTGRVAVVNSLPDEANTRYYYGFRSGVAYTNGNFGTTAEVVTLYGPEYEGRSEDGAYVEGNYTQSCTDQDAGYGLGVSLIASGCDVLFVAADASGYGAYTAAGEHENVWVIGSEIDQFTYGETSGERNFVLTSVTKNLAVETEAQLSAIVSGAFQGGSRRLTSADNALGYVSADDHQQLSKKTLKILSDAYLMMQDGTIVPGTGPQ